MGKLFAAVESGDVGIIATLLAERIVLRVAGGPLDDVRRGRAAALAFYRELIVTAQGPIRMPAHERIDAGNFVLVVGTPSGGVGFRGLDVYRCRNGRIVEVWLTYW